MTKKQLRFSYEEQQILIDNGKETALVKATILLEEPKISRKDLKFIYELHQTAKVLLTKKPESTDEENDL